MVQAIKANEKARADAGTAVLRLFRPQQPAMALGLAVSYLVSKPAFANLRFGDWTRILIGQINRRHYYFAVDGNNKVKGFMGWALATKEHAEAWLEGRNALSFEDSLDGQCLIFNAWAADSTKVHRFLVDEARKIMSDKQFVYFKRYYNDGSTRAVRLTVNDFVTTHIRHREQASSASSSSAPPDSSTTT
jgi:hemolysin-activating ACP:hemolysin acyltransferase